MSCDGSRSAFIVFDIDLADAEEPEDLLATIEEQVFQRRFGEVVRIEVQQGMPESMRALLLEELRDDTPEGSMLSERDVQDAGRLLELGDLLALSQLDIPSLRDTPFAPMTPGGMRDDARPVFEAVRERDLLVPTRTTLHDIGRTIPREAARIPMCSRSS